MARVNQLPNRKCSVIYYQILMSTNVLDTNQDTLHKTGDLDRYVDIDQQFPRKVWITDLCPDLHRERVYVKLGNGNTTIDL